MSRNAQILFLTLLIESILVFLFAPPVYHWGFNAFCAAQFVVSSIIYIKVQKKENYFDFDVIFLLTFFFIMFFFPVFMYGTDVEKLFFAFQFDYNENVISRSSALSLLGAQAYMFGNSLVNVNKIKNAKVKQTKVIPNGILTIVSALFVLLFFVSAGSSLFSHQYDGKLGGDTASGAVGYVLLALNALVFSALIIESYNWTADKMYRKNYWLFGIIGLIVAVFLVIGSRGTPLQLVLILFGLYSLKKKAINLKMMFLVVILGVLVLTVVGMFRGGEENAELGAFAMIQDLVLNNRNTFMAVDFVDKNGITFGQSMLSVLLSPIPFLQSFIFNTFGVNPIYASSSLLITYLSLGTEDLTLGFGTNIIADLYMSFGMGGVLLFMTFLGYFIRVAMLKAKYQNDIYYLICYGVMVSYSVFLVRAEFLFFFRLLIWCLVIINIAKLHKVTLTLISKYKQ